MTPANTRTTKDGKVVPLPKPFNPDRFDLYNAHPSHLWKKSPFPPGCGPHDWMAKR